MILMSCNTGGEVLILLLLLAPVALAAFAVLGIGLLPFLVVGIVRFSERLAHRARLDRSLPVVFEEASAASE